MYLDEIDREEMHRILQAEGYDGDGSQEDMEKWMAEDGEPMDEMVRMKVMMDGSVMIGTIHSGPMTTCLT